MNLMLLFLLLLFTKNTHYRCEITTLIVLAIVETQRMDSEKDRLFDDFLSSPLKVTI